DGGAGCGFPLYAERPGRTMRADPHWGIQHWGELPAGIAAIAGASPRSDRLWAAARIVWAGRTAGGGTAAAPAKPLVGGWVSGGSHRGLRGDDFRCGTGGGLWLVKSGIVCKRDGMDRDTGLPECGRTNHVSTGATGAGALDVFAGSAGRHGPGQRGLGGPGLAHWGSIN